MAVTHELNSSSYDGRYMKLSCTQIKNIAENKSIINWTLEVLGGNVNYYSTGPTTVKINGITVYSKSRVEWNTYSFPATRGSVSGSLNNVDHDSLGKLQVSCSIATAIYTGTVTTQSNTWDLDSIPRKATITEAPNFNDEQNPILKYSNLAGTNATTLQACITSSNGGTIYASYRDISKTGTSYQFNLTSAERTTLRNACNNAISMTVRFYIKTILSGTTYYDYVEKTLTIVNANPTFTSDNLSYLDTNTTTTAITSNNQNIVQNKSTLKVVYTAASGLKGATIVRYILSINGASVTKTGAGGSNYTFGAINSANDVRLSVQAIDSRGNITTAEKTINMLALSLPTANIILARVNNYEDTTKLKVDGNISSVDSKNVMTIKYKYKEHNSGSYNAYTIIQDNVETSLTLDNSNSYDFYILVSDLFGETPYEITLPNGKLPLFIDTVKNQVGVNEFPEDGEAFRVSGGNSYIEDNLLLGKEIYLKNLFNKHLKVSSHSNCSYGIRNNEILTIISNGVQAYTSYLMNLEKNTYTISFDFTNNNSATPLSIKIYNSSNSTLVANLDFTGTSGHKSLTFTTTTDNFYIRFYSNNSDTSYTNEVELNNVQLEYGSKETTFSPYKELVYIVKKYTTALTEVTKYSDGTMVQRTRFKTTSQAINSAYGSLFLGNYSWSFAEPFIEAPQVTCSEFQWGTSASWGFVGGVYASQCMLRGMDVVSRSTGTDCLISARAEGRWK